MAELCHRFGEFEPPRPAHLPYGLYSTEWPVSVHFTQLDALERLLNLRRLRRRL